MHPVNVLTIGNMLEYVCMHYLPTVLAVTPTDYTGGIAELQLASKLCAIVEGFQGVNR